MNKPVFKIIETKTAHHFVFGFDGNVAVGYSENYTSKAMCEKGIESVKANATDSKNYEMKLSQNGKLYFLLQAKNGEVVFKSKMHENEASRDNGILLLKQFAEEAEVLFKPFQDHD